MSDFLRPHGLQHARLPCSSLSPGVCSNSCPLSWRCYLTISSSATLFSSCPQSFPASVSFPVSWLWNSLELIIRWPKLSFSFSICPSNEYPGLISFRIDWLDLLAIQRILKSLLQHHNFRSQVVVVSLFSSMCSQLGRWLNDLEADPAVLSTPTYLPWAVAQCFSPNAVLSACSGPQMQQPQFMAQWVLWTDGHILPGFYAFLCSGFRLTAHLYGPVFSLGK